MWALATLLFCRTVTDRRVLRWHWLVVCRSFHSLVGITALVRDNVREKLMHLNYSTG